MKAIIIAGVAALAIGAAVESANAQSVGVGVGPVGVGITFTPEQRTVVREYVQRQQPMTIREELSVGATLPEEVEIREVPPSWGPAATRYRYVSAGERVYFVEPSSRRVVHVIE